MGNRTRTSVVCNPVSAFTAADLVALNCDPNPRLAWALALRRMGCNPTPLCGPSCSCTHASGPPHPRDRAGKTPLLASWQKATKLPTEQQIRKWWEKWPDANLGVTMGRLSGLVGIDVDGPAGEELLAELSAGDTPPTWEFVTGGGGRRILFRLAAGVNLPTRHVGNRHRPLSIQGGGSQTVMPPSIHHSGGVYAWSPGRSPADVPLADMPAWVIGAATAKQRPAERRTVGGIGAGIIPAGELAERVNRARAYLAKCGPAVEGAGGDSQTYKVVCKVIGMFSLPIPDALELLAEWNRTCVPPWSEVDLERKCLLAATRHGENPIESVRGRGIQNGTTRGPGDGSTRPAASSSASSNGAPPASSSAKLPGVLLSEVTSRSYEWFDGPFIPRAAVTFIVGRPGTGKSTYLARLVSLSRFALYFPGEEDTGRALRPRLEAAGARPEKVRLIPPGHEWGFPAAGERLLKLIGESGADLVCFDPIDDYTADGFDENSNRDVRALLDSLRQVAERTGAAIVPCRHPGKASDNVMVGSRAWGTHPRSIVELVADQAVPPERTVRMYKPLSPFVVPPHSFELMGEPGRFARFTLGGVVTPEQVELARAVTDPMDRRAIGSACELLRGCLANGRLAKVEILRLTRAEGFNDKTVERAAERMGVEKVREGSGSQHKSYWSLPDVRQDDGGEVG